MSFVADILEAVFDPILHILVLVAQLVEEVIDFILELLGFEDQIIEYYEVQNIPLFEDVDAQNPLLNTVRNSILRGEDIASNLIYSLSFPDSSLKTDIRTFLKYIEDGNYFEGFPTIESHILVIDYDELIAALQTLTGVPCTSEQASLTVLDTSSWVKYWLQENKGYNVGTNTLGVTYSTTSEDTVTVTPSTNNFDIDIIGEIATADAGTINSVAIDADTVTVTPSTNHFDIDITSEIASSDTVNAIASSIGSQPLQVNFGTIVYNSGADNYTVQVYDTAGLVLTLPYTVPSKPTQLHYISTYYKNSTPSRQYIFIYKVGTGVYTDLDTVEEPIDIDGTLLQVLPAIPLRISNSNYTTFGATKVSQIEGLCALINLEPEELINSILTDSGLEAGDIDNVYINFGVRMWDTSQMGLAYLFIMFENLYPSQGSTQGTYNNAPASDSKPQNKILTTTEDNKAGFQWSYITYEHTSVAAINADSGSVENGIYYSDMSRFNSSNILVYSYYVSSGKGTYNVGYKADNLTEVAAFLAGSGVVNPGTTTGEATNWLQVTTRLSYNNTTPVLLDSDNTTSDLIYLTPDLVYENNGSGTLRLISVASEATTVGQSITYYCCKPSGLDAYTVVAPIGALKVIDGETGRFKFVKFNLGAKNDLMVPFIHTFIKDLSNKTVTQLFLAGAHISIYIAHYEVIGLSLFEKILIIVIIIIIIYVAYQTGADFSTMLGTLKTAFAAGGIWGALAVIGSLLVELLIKLAIQHIIKLIIVEIVGEDSYLATVLSLLVGIAIASWDLNIAFGSAPDVAALGTYGHTGGATLGAGGGSLNVPGTINPQGVYVTSSFKAPTMPNLNDPWEVVKLGNEVVNTVGKFITIRLKSMNEELDVEIEEYGRMMGARRAELEKRKEFIDTHSGIRSTDLLNTQKKMFQTASLNADAYYAIWENKSEMIPMNYLYTWPNNTEAAVQFS